MPYARRAFVRLRGRQATGDREEGRTAETLSMHGLLLLVAPEGHQAAAGDLDDLETHTGKITLRVSGTTEAGNEHLIVLVNEGHTTITRHVGSDSLVVLLELDSDTLTDGGVGLLGFDSDLLDDDSGSVR